MQVADAENDDEARFCDATDGTSIISIEPALVGLVFEFYDLNAPQIGGERVAEVGAGKFWNPPNRLAFDWCLVDFTADEKADERHCRDNIFSSPP